MANEWTQFRKQVQEALGELVEGRSDPFKALWSHTEDVSIMGAFGGYERGWSQVGPRLDWAGGRIGATHRSVENILTVVGEELACTVDLERMERPVDGRTTLRVLRCTQVYRREDDDWKVIHRHADEVAETACASDVNAGIKMGQLVELSRDKTGTAEPASDRPD